MAFAILGLVMVTTVALFVAGLELTRGTRTVLAAPTPLPLPAGAPRFASLLDLERGGLLRPGTQLVLTIPEAELNARVADAVARRPDLPFHDVTTRILDGEVVFSGRARVAGVDVPTTVALALFARGGSIAYDIVSVDFGPVAVPATLRQAVQDSIDRQLASQRLTEGLVVDGIQARRGSLVIVARAR